MAELMAVIAIMSILVVVGIISIRVYLAKAHRVEVQAVVKAIAAAQESYRAEHLQYHPTSGPGGLASPYPMSTPDGQQYSFYGWTGTLGASWEELGPAVTTPVRFNYALVAGLPTTTPATDFPDTALTAEPAWPVTRSPWYVVQARGVENGSPIVAVTTSFSPTVYWEKM